MDKSERWNILRKYIHESGAISDGVCDFFFGDNEKYILGVGRQAAVVLEICRNFKTEIKGIISENNLVSADINVVDAERKGYWRERIGSLPVKNIDELPDKEQVQVILTVGNQRYEAVEKALAERGFLPNNIFRCDWEHNTDLRKICYRLYKDEYDAWRGI